MRVLFPEYPGGKERVGGAWKALLHSEKHHPFDTIFLNEAIAGYEKLISREDRPQITIVILPFIVIIS